MILIKGERIYLRSLMKKDAKDLARLANEKFISVWTTVPHPFGIKDAMEFIKKTRIKNRKKESVELGIFLKGTDQFMGMCGLTRINKKFQTGEIGYWIGKPYRKQGYTTEATRLVVKYAFEKLKLYRIEISHLPRNKASENIIKCKLNAKLEGISRKSIINGLGKRSDRMIYSLLRPEYLKLKKKWH